MYPLPDNQNDRNNYNSNFAEQKVSPKTVAKIRRLFVILLSMGLCLGIAFSFVVVKLMNHWGLTDKTPQFERIQN